MPSWLYGLVSRDVQGLAGCNIAPWQEPPQTVFALEKYAFCWSLSLTKKCPIWGPAGRLLEQLTG